MEELLLVLAMLVMSPTICLSRSLVSFPSSTVPRQGVTSGTDWGLCSSWYLVSLVCNVDKGSEVELTTATDWGLPNGFWSSDSALSMANCPSSSWVMMEESCCVRPMSPSSSTQMITQMVSVRGDNERQSFIREFLLAEGKIMHALQGSLALKKAENRGFPKPCPPSLRVTTLYHMLRYNMLKVKKFTVHLARDWVLAIKMYG